MMCSGTTTTTDIERGLGEAFWTLANLVCAFAVAQMIAYMMAAGAGESKISGGVHDHWISVLAAIAFATLIYGWVLGLFAKWHWKLLKMTSGDTYNILWWTSAIRITTVFAINIIGMLVTWKIGQP